MKRLTYTQVHKNKRRKKSIAKKQRWVNPAILSCAMITAIGSFQIELLKAMPIPNYSLPNYGNYDNFKRAMNEPINKERSEKVMTAALEKRNEIYKIILDTSIKSTKEIKKSKYYNFKKTGHYENTPTTRKRN